MPHLTPFTMVLGLHIRAITVEAKNRSAACPNVELLKKQSESRSAVISMWESVPEILSETANRASHLFVLVRCKGNDGLLTKIVISMQILH